MKSNLHSRRHVQNAVWISKNSGPARGIVAWSAQEDTVGASENLNQREREA